MNTSSKNASPAPLAASVEAFRYPEAIASDFLGNAVSPEGALCDTADNEVTRLLAAAEARGLRAGEENERARNAQQLEQERARIGGALQNFKTDIAEYYARMEVEVVTLALAIASKILQREAQADPTLVPQMAKAALQKLHQSTSVRVRVPAADTKHWQQFLSQQDGKLTAEVIADDSVAPQSCILETQLGSTDVGINAQLSEIRNGIFDLLAETPQAK